MKIPSSILIFISLLSGCVSTRNVSVSDERTNKWQGKTVALTSRPRADFVAMTAGKAAFGLIGAAAMIEAGNSIVEKNGIEDPAPILGQSLLSDAETQYGVVAADPARVAIDTTDVSKMANAAHSADLLLDVQPMGSQFRYFPADWSHYAVDSGFKVRLIDVHSASLIAEGFCHQTTQKDASPPTKDELLADGAARLKTILTTQREVCLQQLKKDVLAIT